MFRALLTFFISLAFAAITASLTPDSPDDGGSIVLASANGWPVENFVIVLDRVGGANLRHRQSEDSRPVPRLLLDVLHHDSHLHHDVRSQRRFLHFGSPYLFSALATICRASMRILFKWS